MNREILLDRHGRWRGLAMTASTVWLSLRARSLSGRGSPGNGYRGGTPAQLPLDCVVGGAFSQRRQERFSRFAITEAPFSSAVVASPPKGGCGNPVLVPLGNSQTGRLFWMASSALPCC